MIIQALAQYYRRKVNNGDTSVAPFGFEYKKIPYVLVLRPDGTPVQIQINKDADGKPARPFCVPQSCGRSGKRIEANLLWDNFEYALGFPNNEETTRKHEAFRARLDKLGDISLPDWNAVRQFVALSYEEKTAFLQKIPGWIEASKTPNNITFKLKGSLSIVAERPEVKQAIEREAADADAEPGRCMITNATVPIARKHLPQIKIRGGQSSGATLVSYNENAFCSFGKKQGANAPVGQQIVFEYATALNALLATPDNRFYLGDMATVFWARNPSDFETVFGLTLGTSANDKNQEESEDNPDAYVDRVKEAYNAIYKGGYNDATTEEDQFYVLGLSPNNARISVRFWRVGTVAQFAKNIKKYFEDIKIDEPRYAERPLPLNRILNSVAAPQKRRQKGVPVKKDALTHLASGLVRAVLDDSPFPYELLEAVIRRNRADKNVTPIRAALIRAYINRFARFGTPEEQERKQNDPTKQWEQCKMELDLNKENVGYQLGRYFATLERIQRSALGKTNSTVRSRFYASASTTPATAFSYLTRLSNFHLTKIEQQKPGLSAYYQKLLDEISLKIENFPPFLSLINQGQFALGYRHQRDAFRKKKDDSQEVAKR